jgi:hypothetical protein
VSKVFKLKKWLPLDEAVNHISNVLGEPITLADIYKCALDGHLILSANFVNGSQAKEVFLDENGWISESCSVKPVKDELFPIKGLWDLTMLGSERADIEHLYHQETSGISVKDHASRGVFLQQGNTLCQLFTTIKPSSEEKSTSNKRVIKRGLLALCTPYNNFRPKISESNGNNNSEDNQSVFHHINHHALGLDEEEHVLVIRTDEVTRFIQTLEDKPQEATLLTPKERNSLLVLLGAVCKHADIDPSQRGITTSLVAMTGLIAAPLSDDTIRKILNQIGPAIESKSQ